MRVPMILTADLRHKQLNVSLPSTPYVTVMAHWRKFGNQVRTRGLWSQPYYATFVT